MNIAPEIIKRAEQLHKDTGISLQEAFGQVIGGLVAEVDAELFTTKDHYRLEDHQYGDFATGIYGMLRQWFLRK